MRHFWAPLLFSFPLFAADVAIAPQSLSFATQFRTGATAIPPPQQAIVLTSPEAFAFTIGRPAADAWLGIPVTFTGQGPTFVPVAVNPGALGPGTYTSSITVKTSQGSVSIPIRFVVSATPVLLTDPAILGFDPTSSGFQQVAVGISNGANFVANATTTAPWLTVRSNGTSLTVAASSPGAALSASSISVSAVSLPSPSNNPLSIPVLYLGSGLVSRPPLIVTPSTIAFTGSGSQQVTITGAAFTASADSKWLAVTSSGQTLTLTANTAGLDAGTFESTVVLNSGGVLQLPPVSLTLGLPSLTKIVNAASWQEGAVAPGEIVVLGGANLGPATLAELAFDANGLVSTTLAGVQVTFNGVPAPLVYASSTLVAAVAPYDLDGKTTAAVQVTVGGRLSNSLTVPVTAAAPGIFTANASGSGPAASFRTGDTLSIYLTGEGQTNPGGVDGKVTTTPPVPRLQVTATIDGQPAEVVFAGGAPQIVSGVMQVNLRIPPARTGDLPVIVSVGGVASQSGVTLSVR
jgi:uncharacterized protein (TIGR03437 family)